MRHTKKKSMNDNESSDRWREVNESGGWDLVLIRVVVVDCLLNVKSLERESFMGEWKSERKFDFENRMR